MIFRHGSEPAVSLVYSDKGSTGSRISLGWGDEVSRELRENNSRNSAPGNSEDQNRVMFEVCSAMLPINWFEL
jgi:hypothetical protein